MNPIFLFCPMLLLAAIPVAVAARSTDAERYVNAQGIEVIQNRSAAAPEEMPPATPKPSLGSKGSIGNAQSAAPVSAIKQGIDSRLQISSKEQDTRDRGRRAILNQELMNEAEAFQAKWKILHTPSLKAKLSDDEAQRLQETVSAHEQNIRSLTAEISRIRASR